MTAKSNAEATLSRMALRRFIAPRGSMMAGAPIDHGRRTRESLLCPLSSGGCGECPELLDARLTARISNHDRSARRIRDGNLYRAGELHRTGHQERRGHAQAVRRGQSGGAEAR